MAMKLELAIAEKHAVIQYHIRDLDACYGIDWRRMPSAKSRLQLVASASKIVARLQELEAEMASLLATQHDVDSAQRRADQPNWPVSG